VKVHWTPEALRDRDDIYDYIAADSPSAAERMDTIFRNAADRLVDHPDMGRRGELPGTRELFPHKNITAWCTKWMKPPIPFGFSP